MQRNLLAETNFVIAFEASAREERIRGRRRRRRQFRFLPGSGARIRLHGIGRRVIVTGVAVQLLLRNYLY